VEKSWTNQYIDLIKSKPDYIVCSDSDELKTPQIEVIKERLKFHSRIFCEIGSGSGEHLLLQAAKNPRNLYVGLELRFKRIFRTAEKAEVQGLKNIIVIRHNARKIDEIFEQNSLKGIYINFPDPWSGKRRWEKHRLLSEEYLKTLENLLGASGFISYKTDHRERFLQICDILKTWDNLRVSKLTLDLVSSEFYSGNPESEFERLFMKKKQPVYFLFSEKV
jgi:tRNA (guanine-N7-)-methyltransferase